MSSTLEKIGLVVVASLFGAGWATGQSRLGTATIEFTKATYLVNQNAGGVTVTLQRTGNTNSAVDVVLATVDGTAVASRDFIPKKGIVTIAAGKMEEPIHIPIIHDVRLKGSRIFKLTLSDPSGGATLGPQSSADVVIEEGETRKAAWLHFGLDQIEGLDRPLFEIPLWQYLASFIYIFLAFYAAKLVDLLVRGQLTRWTRKTKTQFDDLLLDLARGPVKVIAFVALLRVGLRIFFWPDWFADFLKKAMGIIVAVTITYMVLKFIDLVMGYWKRRVDAEDSVGKHLLPLIRHTLKVFVAVVAVLITLQNLGLNITSLIASLSIAGLAVSLAAQDTLSNLFGAVAMLSDKPFRIGDRIKVENVEGVVESIGLRSTRVVSAEGNIVSIPNKIINNATITNLAGPTGAPK